jgi:hypothetical protein
MIERTSEEPSLPASLGWCVLWAAWTAVRLPILALLTVLEPVVRFVLFGVALLMTLSALFWAALKPIATFPFFGMLAFAVGCMALRSLYLLVMRLFSARL